MYHLVDTLEINVVSVTVTSRLSVVHQYITRVYSMSHLVNSAAVITRFQGSDSPILARAQQREPSQIRVKFSGPERCFVLSPTTHKT